ncbi:hypothetical protein GCM10009716_48770 [Streptomyces sodiiphilus]|uniref:DNA/RNA non-specific endonuclease n=1 Tax=Streptomyces sodiiphilus TaxID=226217 RepID=A0ABN2PX39_9ACTN
MKAPAGKAPSAAQPGAKAGGTSRSAGPAARTSSGPAAPAVGAGGPVGLSRLAVQRLQGAAGNAAVSRLVAQRYAEVVKTPPEAAAGFKQVTSEVAEKQAGLKEHRPAEAESAAAQDAAQAPQDDVEAQGKHKNAGKMDEAEAGDFDKAAFVKAVNEAIAAQAPQNLDEADKFADSGKADQVKEQVSGQVADGKESSAEDIAAETEAAPDTSEAKEKEVTPLTSDKPPGDPGAPSADAAVPDKQPDEVLDFSEGPRKVDEEMAGADVTEEQLAKGNEPQFDEALDEKRKGEEATDAVPAEGRAAENESLAKAKSGAAAAGSSAMSTMAADREKAGKNVDAGKDETKSEDEKRREKATAKLQKVFDRTQKDVEKILDGLDGKVDKQFETGEKRARDAFTADHKERMKEYKKKRYKGIKGKARWVRDKFKGLPQEGLDIFQKSRKLYVDMMQTLIGNIADTIGTELGRAKQRIKQGRQEMKAEVDKLPDDLKRYGQEAAADFNDKFDDLESDVDAKSEQLVSDLAQKYTEALSEVDAEIQRLQDEHKGLIAKVMDAVAGAIQTILELKNLLLGVLSRAASAVGKIIKDPISFLGNLISGLGDGLRQFTDNIEQHMKTGVVSWLLGTAVKSGIQIPAKFDIKGIIGLLASLLNLTWDSIRAKILRKGVPEPAMAAAEKSVPAAQALAREGPGGAAQQIQQETGDLKKNILNDLKTYLIPTVIIAGITWIISLLNPASAFTRAVKAIIDIVTFIVTQGAQIIEFLNACIDAVVAIANGDVGAVPQLIETALTNSLPLLIGFLAALIGIGGLANKVKQVFLKAAKPVGRAIDRIVDTIAKKAKRLWRKLKKKGDKRQELPEAKKQAKSIMAKHELENSPVAAVTSDLLTLRNKFHWIKGFTSKERGGSYALVMKASENPLGRYRKIETIKMQLDKYGPVFIKKVHHHWWERQLRRPKTGEKPIWSSSILNGADADALAYLQQKSTALEVKSKYYDGTGREVAKAAFEKHVFGAGSVVRSKVVSMLGKEALPKVKGQGKQATGGDQENFDIIDSMEFLAAQGIYGKFKPFPKPAEEREHTDFYPTNISFHDNGNVRVTTYATRAGKTFKVTETDPQRSMKVSVEAKDLRLKAPGAPRGVTQDSPGFLPNQDLNRAHVIADWFGGSGYREALNLVTTSGHYNKQVMGGAESAIAAELLAFAEGEGVSQGEVALDLKVTVSFGELLKDVFVQNIANQPWFKPGDPKSVAELKRLTGVLLNPPVRRVTAVVYEYTLTSLASGARSSDMQTIDGDDWLFIERGAG